MGTRFITFLATPVLALTTTLLLSSCDFIGGERVSGNGKMATQQRNVGAFNSIDIGGAVEVHVRQDQASSVRIETDENLQPYLEAYVEGGTLMVKTRKGYNLDPSKEIIVYASAPEFKSLEISGASKIIGDGPISGNELELHASGASELTMEVKVSKLKAELSGASTLQLKGSSQSVSTEASGSSKVKCMDLATDETTLDLSGASDAEVTANKRLNIDASGSSDVKYRGNASIKQNSSGASSVQKVS